MGQDFWPQLGGNMFNGGDKKPKPGGNNRKNSSPQKSPVRKTGLNAEKLTNTSPWLNKKNGPSGEKKETEQRSGGSGSNPNSNPNSSSNNNKNFAAPMPQVQYVHVLNLPGQPNGQQSPGMALLFSVLGLALSMLRAKILMRLVVGTASKSEKPSRWRKKYLEQTPVTFQDVAGCEEAKREVREFVDLLKNPSRFKRLGARTPRGALLTGPPGTGKTLMAKAVAGEAGVPFFYAAGSDFVELYVGVGAARVRELFREARRHAPCIVYIDEIDAVGKRRNERGSMGGGNDEREATLNQLLVEMDGFETGTREKEGEEEGGGGGGDPAAAAAQRRRAARARRRARRRAKRQYGRGGALPPWAEEAVAAAGRRAGGGEVVVLASTNRPDALDEALKRKGRLDRNVAMAMPDLKARERIFLAHLPKLLLAAAPEAYAPRLAAMTPGLVGADIANLCNEAAIQAARRRAARVSLCDFEAAADRVTIGLQDDTRATPEDRLTVAYHEAGHAVAGWHCETTATPLKVSIIPRGWYGGFTQSLEADTTLRRRQHIEDELVALLAGRAAELLTFGHATTGASDDLRRATELAYAAVARYGLDEAVGQMAFPGAGPGGASWEDGPGQRRAYADPTAELIDQRARAMVSSAYERAQQLLSDKREQVEALAQVLLENETASYDDLLATLGPRPYALALHRREPKLALEGWVPATGEPEGVDARAVLQAKVVVMTLLLAAGRNKVVRRELLGGAAYRAQKTARRERWKAGCSRAFKVIMAFDSLWTALTFLAFGAQLWERYSRRPPRS